MVEEKITAAKTEGILLFEEIKWLEKNILHTIECHFNKIQNGEIIQPPLANRFHGPYAQFIKAEKLDITERLLLILAMAPHINPSFLDEIISKGLNRTGDFPQIGGVKGTMFRGFLPTLETAVFILTGTDLAKRLRLMKGLLEKPIFKKALQVTDVPLGEPLTAGKLMVSPEYIEQLTQGTMSKPAMNSSFPAQYITTDLEWDDLVLNEKTREQIGGLQKWLKYNEVLLHEWGMKSRLNPGFRVLFHGPPGTGKTLTASLLGKYTGRDVFRIDLSMVVSKYIGETEKNLANLFDKAENKGWILFFDEADALFGKRTNVKDAHDKFANQEVSFLLQRTETFEGMVILASNFKHNMDEAFARRFQSHIHFPPPKFAERLLLWEKALPDIIELEKSLSIHTIARQYELTGANIMNVVQHACIQAIARNEHIILLNDIIEGIEKEYSKEGKIL